jgi:uncharacterized protein YjcR
MEKIEILEHKIKNAVEIINSLRKENQELIIRIKELEKTKTELESFKMKRNKAKAQVEEILDSIDKIQLDLDC